MAGWLTDGVPNIVTTTGAEQASFDTQLTEGQNPQTVSITMQQLAAFMLYYGNFASKTTVSGSRYYVSVNIATPALLTGIAVLVGSAGTTDKWIVELHNSAGALVATSDTAGTTSGTAGTWQQIPFTAPYSAAIGTYYIALQANGNTDHPAVYNSPTSTLLTGTATGVFGTGASITPPTTYTAADGPVATVY